MRRTIAIFGSSEPRPGESEYQVAERVGAGVAEAGWAVITGGYGGVMEAASRGARAAGGDAIGVASQIFGGREPNAFLTSVVGSEDLFERTRELVVRADGFVVLPGKAGTLSELSMLWALDRVGMLERPLVLYGEAWSPLLDLCREAGYLDASTVGRTWTATTVSELVDRLRRGLLER